MSDRTPDERVERLVGAITLPLLLACTLGGAAALMRSGRSAAFASGIAIASGYVVIAILERLVPYEREWLHSKADLAVDSAWFATNGVLNRLLEPPLLAVAVGTSAWLAGRVGATLWPVGWPLGAQLPLALLTAEWFEYWVHRLMHENAFLWRFHALHHSAPRLYWLNAVRFHPLDTLLLSVGKLLPLAILGAPPGVLALVNVFSAVHGSLKHANVPARIGPLNWVFSMAELHRWHHSPNPEEANNNYGGNLIVWDTLFGTRFLPQDRRPPAEVGLAAAEWYPSGYWAQWVAPFRRRSPHAG